MQKKTFKDKLNTSPAASFISQETIDKVEHEEVVEEIPTKPPAGYKFNDLFVETRSRRLQLLVQPSLYRKIKHRADREGVSVNELVNSGLMKLYGDEEV